MNLFQVVTREGLKVLIYCYMIFLLSAFAITAWYILDIVSSESNNRPSDLERLMLQLNRLVDVENTVIMMELDMHVIAASDWVIDIEPGAGEDDGKIVAGGVPSAIVNVKASRTAVCLKKSL